MVQNCSPIELTLARDEIIGFIEHTKERDMQQLNPKFIASMAKNVDIIAHLPP